MGVRDALLHNITGSNFEALQSGDTARIKGDFSVKNTSDVEIFGVDVSSATVNVAGNITSTMNVSGSVTSTGSFGRFVASTYVGDGAAIKQTLVRSSGLITASAQIASDISGAFERGFFFGFQASSSISGGMGITGSFGRLQGEEFFGSGVGLQSTLPRSPGLITGSAQLASRISGSFNKGFEFTGTIVGDTSVCSHNSLPGVTSIGASMATGQSRMLGIGLSPNAAIAISSGDAENYDGTAWSEAIASTPFNNANVHSEFGTQNDAAFLCNGYVAITTVWDGTAPASFTNNAHQANNTDGVSAAGAGLSSNAGLKLDPNGKTECYNGSAWTELNTMPGDATTEFGMSGDTEAALKTGGAGNSTNGTQIWNGTNWSEGASLSTATSYGRNQGSVNASLYSGGYSADRPGGNCSQEEYNGTSWAAGGNLVLGVSHHQSLGKNSGGPGGLTFGGESGYDAPAPAADPGGVGGPSFEGATASGRLLQIYEGPNTTTGSFGRLESTTLSGDATNLRTTLPYSTGLVTGSAQLANRISGSFNKGFEFTNKISGSSTSTGSFGRVDAIEFHGDGTALRETLTRNTGTVTGSAQLASRISGSFTSGFAFTTTSSLGHATGSLISASAGGTANLTVDRVKSNFFTGDGANLVQLIAPGLVSGSAQLGVSGSFTSGFQYKNQISGSVISTGSFGRVDSDNFVGDGSLLTNIPIPTGLVTGSGQLAAQISGAFTSGFEYAGKISGSVTSTGSFGRVENATYFGDGSNIKDTLASRTAGVISGSAQIAADISGSFNKGFEVTGNILDQKAADHTAGVWTTAANMINSYHGGAGAGNAQNAALHFAGRGFPTTNADTKNTEEWNGSSWTEVNNMINTDYYGTGAGSSESALWMGGYTVPSNKVNEYNGTNWSERATLPGNSEGVGLMKGIGIGRDANVLHIGGATGGTNSNATSCAVKKYSTSTDSWSEETNAPANLGFVGGAGTTEAAIIAREHDYNSLIYNGSSWSTIAAIIDQSKQAGWGSFGTQNDALIAGGSTFDNARRCTQLWNGTSWSEGNAMNLGRGLNAGKMQGGSSGAAGIAFSTHFNGGISAPPGNQNSDATELYNAVEFSNSTGSFGLVKPRGGEINTEAFQVTNASLFKLPVFSDRELNYQAYEDQYQTGSLSGSVDRVADVIVGQNLGEMWFDSDKNAIGYTYQSNSLISQSLSISTFTYTTSSIAAYGAGTYNYSSSIGLFTQSFFSNTVVTCYLTGSQI